MKDLEVGDSVVVKQGVTDPESGADLSGWQGRIQTFENKLVVLSWDSVTLQNMPQSFLEESEEGGYDWQEYYVEIENVESVPARDSFQDVADVAGKIHNQVGWFGFGEEGKRIQKILAGIDLQDTEGAFAAWGKYLKKHLTFPFKATVEESYGGLLRVGHQVTVLNIDFIDDEYGVIVEVKYHSEVFEFPLGDLSAIGKNKSTKQLVQDYAIWFANRY